MCQESSKQTALKSLFLSRRSTPCDRAKPSKELQPTSPVWIQNAALGMALPQKSCGKEHLHEQKKEREKGVKNIPAGKRAKSELKMFFPLGSALPLALCESQFGSGAERGMRHRPVKEDGRERRVRAAAVQGRDQPVAAAARHNGIAPAGAGTLLQPAPCAVRAPAPPQPAVRLNRPSRHVLKPLLSRTPKERGRILEIPFAGRCFCGPGRSRPSPLPGAAAAPEAAAPAALPSPDRDANGSGFVPYSSARRERNLLRVGTRLCPARCRRGTGTGQPLPCPAHPGTARGRFRGCSPAAGPAGAAGLCSPRQAGPAGAARDQGQLPFN